VCRRVVVVSDVIDWLLLLLLLCLSVAVRRHRRTTINKTLLC